MNKEESFALGLAKLEEERIAHGLEVYSTENYLQEEFSFNIKEENAKTKVYYLLQQVWAEGILELFIRNNILTNKLEVKDLVAFDSARFTKLICDVLTLKLIEEKEAWGLLFLNAKRVQDSFSSATEFKESYFKGSLFYDILFKCDTDYRAEKIKNFDSLFRELQKRNKVMLVWLEEDIFQTFKKETSTTMKISLNKEASLNKKAPLTLVSISRISSEKNITLMHTLLKKEDKTNLWKLLDNFNEEERNKFLHHLYTDELSNEEYLELPAHYPNIAYAHYLRGVYFYNYAWKARGFGIVNTVGQKNYALFYERLRYAITDISKAYELSPNEQTYWAELYNLVKHFNSKEKNLLQETLYQRIKTDAMQNLFCIQRVSHLKKARWGGSHKESLEWAREVISQSGYGNPIKVIIFETLIEQYNYIIEFDKDEKSANAIFRDNALQKEVNGYFDELVEHPQLQDTLLFWYEKVGDDKRVKMIVKNK